MNYHAWNVFFNFRWILENSRSSYLIATKADQILPIVKADRKRALQRVTRAAHATRVTQKPSTSVDVERRTGGKTHGSEQGGRFKRSRVGVVIDPRVVAVTG